MMAVAKNVLELAKRCARGLHGMARRVFQAEVTREYLDGDARRAERVFGWNRKAVTKGLVEQAIDAEMEEQAQADPKFQTAWSYTRATAANVRQETAARWNENAASLPSERTFRRILNRRGFRLRRVQKTKPIRKIPQTDAIFANVARSREESRDDPQVLRISLDTKAKVPIGPFSRRGRARGKSAVRAADHDMKPLAKLVPVGILEVERGHLSIYLGTSRETADFLADSLKAWWDVRKSQHVQVRKLVIELDNGPEVQSHRTQFMRRLTEFADSSQLEIELVYFPPYHSKYNPIERCWSALERHWNGSLLNSVSAAINWARTMTWKMLHPTVELCETVYERGVRLTRAAFAAVEERLERAPDLSRWSVRIQPRPPAAVLPAA
jgi:Rhodopirellula transposase DDE domain